MIGVVIKFYRFPEDQDLCIRVAVDEYIKRRREWRSVKETQLLVSFNKPDVPVATSSISRWLKDVMNLSGINTEAFSGHSTRSGSVTKAQIGGASVFDIVKCGHWSNSSTFQKFYHKEVIDSGKKIQKAL